ncbi:peroxisome biogenesis protein 3-2-like [Mercurialis annua]|uniref:peroxisome biogenesis protein 3-2-like n=1 Tax=Mercurialis annua TaxID=3986 RepID=UPI00216027FA|nr:peroxisome biogenesis protein 3-2-like [Mercurialis annua]
MLPLRGFWRRHRRKFLITSGVLGGGYFLYKLYNAHKCRLADLEKELANEREHEELIKAQVAAHFENIQRIADTTTLPHAMRYLSIRIAEELDLSQLTEKLMKGKGQPSTLTPLEKLELWDRLKILSFTRLVVSLWAMTILSLYIRTQVNILGRHLYIDTARLLGSSLYIEDVDIIERDGQKKFLASSDFLANVGIQALSSDVQLAAAEVFKGKQLRDFFNTTTLHETVMQILDLLMSRRSPHHWVEYVMPADTTFDEQPIDSISDDALNINTTKFEQLMAEARAVISSAEFLVVLETSLKVAVEAIVDDLGAESGGGSLTSGMPLARVVPRVAQICPLLLEEPSENRYLQIIRTVQQAEQFFSILYAGMPTS